MRMGSDFCFGFNTEGKPSPYEMRHGVESNHDRIPFGARVDFMPTPADAEKYGPFEPKRRSGIFLGYHQQPGGRIIGDYYVVDMEPFLSNPDAAPKDCRIHCIKEVHKPGMHCDLVFPLASYV